MIVEDLTNFSSKSFKNYSTEKSFFQEKNLIFGYNGRGKSAFSEGVLKKIKQENAAIDFLRYFNKDYITRNILFEDKIGIRGVSAKFSEEEITNQEQIEELKTSINDIDEIKKELTNLENETRKRIDFIHDTKKGTANINKKPRSRSTAEIFSLYENDYMEGKKFISEDMDMSTFTGDNSIDLKIDIVENLKIPNLSIGEIKAFKYVDLLEKVMIKNYEDLEIPSYEIINWLNDGVKFHENEETCKFCGGYLDYNELHQRLKNFNDSEKKNAQTDLKEFNSLLSTWVDEFDKSFNDEAVVQFKEVYSEAKIDKILKDLKEYKESLIEISDTLNDKFENMDQIFETDYLLCAKDLITQINKTNDDLQELKKNKLTDLRLQSDNLGSIVKAAIGYTIQSDSTIINNLQLINEKEKEAIKKEKENNEIHAKIDELENITSGHEDFRKFLNSVLESIGIDLKLVSLKDGKDYALEHSKYQNNPLTLEDISEGEKNLLALLFFYFELYKDKDQEILKSQIKLIIIDDPVSSLDESNKFLVLEMMKKLLSEENVQVFILTHVWDDFCQLSYGSNGRISLFEISKNNNSESRIVKSESPVIPYRKLFKDIYLFSIKTSPDEFDQNEFYHIPNSMRRVFEEFLKFKSGNDIIPTKNKFDKICQIIIQNTNDKKIDGDLKEHGNYLSGRKKIKINKLLTVINVLSHQSSFNKQETLDCAKFLMKLIEDMDKAHFCAMKI